MPTKNEGTIFNGEKLKLFNLLHEPRIIYIRPQANLCSVQVSSSYRGTKIYLHKLVHGSELILKLKVLHLFCSHFREFLH